MKRIDQITLKQLRALDMVARTGNISTAGELLGLTGPAVHSQLKTLEEAIGSPLIHRQGSDRNTPTAQGKVLLSAQAEIRATLERAITTMNALDRGQSGSVVLGVVSTAKYFAPRIVALLQDAIPDVDVTLRVGNRRETIAELARGSFDLCIMGRPPREPLTTSIHLAPHPHVIIASADHPLAQLDHVPQERLLREPFVMREPGSGTRILAARYLDDIGHGHQARIIEMDSNETIKQAVLSGLGLAMISAHTVAEELRSGRLVALPCDGVPIIRSWYMLTDAGRPLAPAALNVRNWIVEHIEDILPSATA